MIIKNNQGFVLPCITIRTQQLLANNNYILNNKQLNYLKKNEIWSCLMLTMNQFSWLSCFNKKR